MTSSYTANLGLQQPATGDQTNSWGTTVNTDWGIVDNAVAGLASINLPAQSGYPTVVLTFTQGSSSQELPNRRLDLVGALTANTLVLFPQGRNFEMAVTNGTSGAFSLTLGVNNGSGGALGATVVVSQGATMELFSDGTNTATRAVTGPSTVVAGNLAAFSDFTGGVLQDSGVAPASLVPAGTILEFAGSTAPSGYLLANGQAVSRTTYATLFGVCGTAYGAGDGSTTFNVPDKRGRVGAGYDPGNATGRLTAITSQGVSAASLGDAGGEQAHTQTNAELVGHSHSATSSSTSTSTSSVTDPGHAHAYYSNNSGQAGTNNPPLSSASGAENQAFSTTPSTTSISVSTSTTTTTSTAIGADGGGNAFNVVQPTIILNYIIKT
ncbi:MAG: phage tail protein [Stellaceae bacterium]